MADPIIWGPIAWTALLDVAARVDFEMLRNRETSKAQDLQLLLSIIGFCYPCDECSYYGIEYSVSCPAPQCMFVEYVYDMKATVDAKIKTVQFKKYRHEDCLNQHISRLSCLRRAQCKSKPRLDAWAKLFVMSGKFLQGHQDQETREDALKRAVELVCTLYEVEGPVRPVVSFESAISFWSRYQVDTEELEQLTDFAFA